MGQVCIYSGRCEEELYDRLFDILEEDPVFVCIGSDRITGDCLGPIVGEQLVKRYNVPFYVYGTLDYPVNGKNLSVALEFLKNVHRGSKIVAIDASLGSYEDIGMIKFGRGPIQAGGAIRKDNHTVGDYFITGVVNSGSFADNTRLFSTRLYVVNRMAEIIAGAIGRYAKPQRYVM